MKIATRASGHISCHEKPKLNDNINKLVDLFNMDKISPTFWECAYEIHLHNFPTFSELVDKVNEALLVFQKAKQEILNLFGFYTEKPEKTMN